MDENSIFGESTSGTLPLNDFNMALASTTASPGSVYLNIVRLLSREQLQQIFRHSVLCISFVIFYLLLNRPEVILISHLGLVAWYPATGLVLAFMVGISPWYAVPGMLAGALAEALIYGQPIRSFSLILGVIGVTASYTLAAHLLRGRLKIDSSLNRRQDVLRYVCLTTGAALLSTIAGVGCLYADHEIARSEYWQSSLVWFFGDEIGLLAVAPFLLIHILPWVRRQLSPREIPRRAETAANLHSNRTSISVGSLLEAGGQITTIVIVLLVMFGPTGQGSQFLYLCYVPIIWIAMRHGISRVVTGLLVLNFGIVLSLHFYAPTTSVTRVGLLMFVVSAVGLIVGAAVSERQSLATHLLEQTTYLNSLIQNSPLGIMVLNPNGTVELANDAFKKLFQYEETDLAARSVHSMFPADENQNTAELPELILSDKTIQRSIRRRRKDGKLLDLELHTVPVMTNGNAQGAYTIYQDVSDQVEAFTRQRENAESRNRLIKELEIRSQQMALLNEMSNLLECCATTDEAGAVVIQSVQRFFPDAISGTLYVFKSSRNLVETAAKWGKTSPSEALFPPESCWGLRRGQAHWNDDSSEGVRCCHLTESKFAESVCVPLVGQRETLGILFLEFGAATSTELSPLPVTQDLRIARQTLAATVASQIALSLANLRLRETLRDQSIRDPLTSLFNRRFMQESLDREIHRAQRRHQSLSVMILDLDHFKRFNDAFGHDAGDFVLRSLADVFRKFFRAEDVVCRQGGEEFVFILPEASSQEALERANALRDEVGKLGLKYDNKLLGAVTLSLGVATYPEHSLETEELLKIADQCLYQSKAKGRDMVTVASAQAITAHA